MKELKMREVSPAGNSGESLRYPCRPKSCSSVFECSELLSAWPGRHYSIGLDYNRRIGDVRHLSCLEENFQWNGRPRSTSEYNFDTGERNGEFAGLRANNSREAPVGPVKLRLNILARPNALMGLE